MKICDEEKRTIISKDTDFLVSFMVNNKPEKLILVKTGNIKNEDLSNIFKLNFEYICSSIRENDLIEINKTDIVIHK